MKKDVRAEQLLARVMEAMERGFEIEVRTHWFGNFYLHAQPAKTERIRTK
jgi:hypothetical protein